MKTSRIFGILIIFLLTCCCLTICLGIGALIYYSNQRRVAVDRDNTNFACSDVVIGGSSSEEYFLSTIRRYYCDYLPNEPFRINKTGFNYYADLSYDTTVETSGKIVVREIGADLDEDPAAEYRLNKLTVLEVTKDEVLNDRYYFFMLSTLTGADFCPKLTEDSLYKYCGDLKSDLTEFGGIWLFDAQTKQLQRLVGFKG
jgi:hypothetical protein